MRYSINRGLTLVRLTHVLNISDYLSSLMAGLYLLHAQKSNLPFLLKIICINLTPFFTGHKHGRKGAIPCIPEEYTSGGDTVHLA